MNQLHPDSGIKCFFVIFSTVFENKDKIVIVMEYASRGDLYDYICDKKNISEREARHFFRQIVSAVHYCHQVRLFFLMARISRR